MSKRNNNLPQTRHEKALSRLRSAGGPYKQHREISAVPLFADKSTSQRSEDTLQRMDSTGISSPESRTKGIKTMTGLAVAGLIAVTPVGEAAVSAVNDIFEDTGKRIEENYDSHNLPPGGQPTEYRGGVAYEPGTDNTIVIPQTRSEP